MGTVSRRWARMVRSRLDEMGPEGPGSSGRGGSFWDERAEWYAERVAGSARRDPFLSYVRRHVGTTTHVVDVGCGPGRFALPLAARAATVTAVDPSAAMLEIVRRDAAAAGYGNVRTLHAPWPEAAEGVTADVAIASYVVPLVADVVPFLSALDRVATRRVFIYMNAVPADLLTDAFWRHFHGRARRPAPTYLDLVAVLADLGIGAAVRVVEAPTMARYVDLAEAVDEHRRLLLLPDEAEVNDELRGLLESWLVRRGGVLRPPVRSLPAAIVHWSSSGPDLRAR